MSLMIDNLTLQIGNQCLLRQLNMQCAPQQVWGIVGLNGVGKTTLLHTLAGLLQPHEGQIAWQQQNIHQLPHKNRARLMGLLLQDQDFPFPATVLETALLGRYPHQRSWFQKPSAKDMAIAEQALKTVDLSHLSNRSVTTLSGGEKRRLTLATLLTQDPQIYLLDEPTNHLDLPQQAKTLSLFKTLAKQQNKIILMILHNIQHIQAFCDKILIMQKNEKYVICDGNHINTTEQKWLDLLA